MLNSVVMKSSSLIVIFLFLLSQKAFAQQKKDSASLRQAIITLNKALVQKDEKTLNKILSKKLTYAHSNGWIEHKKELIANLFNGKLTYANIELTQTNIAINENVGAVRSKGNFDVIMSEQLLHFKLSVLQVWIWKKGKWILMSRQSVQEEAMKE